MTKTVLSIKDISKSFSMAGYELEVLKNLSLEVCSGETLAITGPSGAGKSTLLHIMGGLERPDSGRVHFEGEDIYKLGKHALDSFRNSNVGYVFQFHYLLDDFTALENVMIPALLGGWKNETARLRAEELLESVGLKERLKHYPKELSGGEQQRVALARALMNKPAIILADEPTGNLDRANSEIVQELLFSLTKDEIAVVIVTHDTAIAEKADRRLEMEKV